MSWLQEVLGEELEMQVNGAIETYNAKPENKDKQIKIGNLGSGAYVSRSKFDDELADLRAKLAGANTDAQKYADLKGKYDQLKNQYDNQKYEYAVQNALTGIRFSSNAAKKAFTDGLIQKKLAFENDQLLGLDDYISAYKAEDPGAFAVDEAEESKPTFMAPAGSTSPAPEKTFGFDFTGVREKIKS